MSTPTNQRLRMVEPFHTEAHVTAEVYFGKLGNPGIVVIQADTDEGPADVTLTPREAFDLMLWLQCALGMTSTSGTAPTVTDGGPRI